MGKNSLFRFKQPNIEDKTNQLKYQSGDIELKCQVSVWLCTANGTTNN